MGLLCWMFGMFVVVVGFFIMCVKAYKMGLGEEPNEEWEAEDADEEMEAYLSDGNDK